MKIVVTVSTYDGDFVTTLEAESKEAVQKMIDDSPILKPDAEFQYKEVFGSSFRASDWRDSCMIETLDEWWESNLWEDEK